MTETRPGYKALRLRSELKQQLGIEAHIAPWNNKVLFIDDLGTEVAYSTLSGIHMLARFHQYRLFVSFGMNTRMETSLNATLRPRSKEGV